MDWGSCHGGNNAVIEKTQNATSLGMALEGIPHYVHRTIPLEDVEITDLPAIKNIAAECNDGSIGWLMREGCAFTAIKRQ